jgi:hypothetical protein
MSVSTWTEADTNRAIAIWNDYLQHHDVTALIGQTAGIDPLTERVWLGGTAKDIWKQMQAEGIDAPLYYVRVGSSHYVRKGGHR